MSDNIDITHIVKDKNIEETFELVDNLLENLKEDFDLRHHEETIQVYKSTKLVTIATLLLGLLLLPVKFCFNRKLTIEDILLEEDTKDINKVIQAYFNKAIIEYDGNDINELLNIMSQVITKLSAIAWQINIIKGNTVNIYDLLHLMKNNKEVYDICNFVSNENDQFANIESSVEKQNKRLIEILKSPDNDTCFKNLLGSISTKQFQQVFVNISLKPDLFGKVIPKPVNSSFFRGMRTSTDYFINAVGARKALIINATQVRQAGYLARKLALLLINTTLDSDIDDCETEEFLSVHIENEEEAKRFTNRYYVLDGDTEYRTVHHDTKKLIGKTIHLRSPTTCKLKGGKICKACYGILADLNQFHIGLSSILLLTEQITQMLN